MLKLAQQNNNHNLSCLCVIFHRKNRTSATQKYGTDSPENVTSVTSVFVVVIHTSNNAQVCKQIHKTLIVIKNINDTPLHYSITVMTMLERCSSTCM